MPEPKSPTCDQVLYERSEYLREHSSELLCKAQELRHASAELRKTNLLLAYDLRRIRSFAAFSDPTKKIHDEPGVDISDRHRKKSFSFRFTLGK
jgi:hypothetical protein